MGIRTAGWRSLANQGVRRKADIHGVVGSSGAVDESRGAGDGKTAGQGAQAGIRSDGNGIRDGEGGASVHYHVEGVVDGEADVRGIQVSASDVKGVAVASEGDVRLADDICGGRNCSHAQNRQDQDQDQEHEGVPVDFLHEASSPYSFCLPFRGPLP